MLRREINLYWRISFLFLISCNINRNNSTAISTNSDIYIHKNFSNYATYFQLLNDTLQSWKLDSLENSKAFFFHDCWVVDSCLVFNSDSTRMLTNHLFKSCSNKNAVSDNMYMLAGAKIKKKWYFFYGITTVIDRASYQDSIYTPLTFDELSYLSRQELSGAYTINPDGSMITNDRFFDFMYNRNDWGLPEHSTLEQLDSLIVARNIKKHKNKIDPKELESIKKEMAASVKPPEPPKKKRSLWDRLFKEEKVKIFESKEWKEYLRNKYGKDVN